MPAGISFFLGGNMKTLYMIGGPMGVGKTTAGQALKRKTPSSVFLDGDWCWDMHPFCVTEETRRVVMDNICCLLDNFIGSPAFDTVIFTWVMHQQGIIDEILRRIHTENCRVVPASLVCTADELRARLQKDVAAGLRQPDVIGRSLSYLSLYDELDTVKIDVTRLTAEETAEGLLALRG